ncbi:MAG: hypothetical protein ACPG4X_16405 [Pikeienuella sp.]
MNESAFETAARSIRILGNHAWLATLCSNQTPNQKALFEAMQSPNIGDIVFESSTIYRRSLDLDAVGILLKDCHEPAHTDWDEIEEGGPCPSERVFYVQTLDGREKRWTNASFHCVPDQNAQNF